MKKITLALAASLLLTATMMSCADKNIAKDDMTATKMVGGAEMFPSKNIIENAVNSADHKTLVAAVKAAGLVQTLSGPGPFTVFAPTDKAFGLLPAGTVDFLVRPENKATLASILTYHVVAGKVNAQDLAKMIRKGGGKASLTTVNGKLLTATKDGDNVYITDVLGNKAMVSVANVYQSNGVIHVLDKVLLPSK